MVAWKITWTWYYLLWVPYTMLLVGVQAWFRWNFLQTQSTPRLNIPHTVIRCNIWSVPPQCMSPPPAVLRPLYWPFLFLVGSVFQTEFKTPWFFCSLTLALWVGWLFPLRILWRFCSHTCQWRGPRTHVFLPSLLHLVSRKVFLWMKMQFFWDVQENVLLDPTHPHICGRKIKKQGNYKWSVLLVIVQGPEDKLSEQGQP